MHQSNIVGSYLSLPFRDSNVSTGGLQFATAFQKRYMAEVSMVFMIFIDLLTMLDLVHW